MAELGSEVRREVNAGITSVSRMMERLETRENMSSPANNPADNSLTEQSNQNTADNHRELPLNEKEKQASSAASSGSH